METFAARYLLLRKLGHGGMGEVFLARDLATGSVCAIKRLNPEIADPLTVLRREFKALAQLRHPVIVQVLDCAVSADGTPYLALEYVPGVPSDRAVDRGDWSSALSVGCRVVEGLEALHDAGVIHGDLKPSNILVSSARGHHRDVRLVDFGLSALRVGPESFRRGTFGFAAPEIVGGGPANTASDLFGLGATLYALITGKTPLEQDVESRSFVDRGSKPDVQALEIANVPWKLIELLLWLLAEKPSERPATARDVRREIERRAPHAARSLEVRLGASRVIGRDRELGSLDQWLIQPKPVPSVALVAGRPGTGRSAFLNEVAARAALGERRVVHLAMTHGTAWGSGTRTLLRMLAAQLPTPNAQILSRLFDRKEPLTNDDLDDWVQQTRSAFASGVGDLLIVIDDADRLDRWSAAWLRRVILAEGSQLVWWVLGHGVETDNAMQVLKAGGVALTIDVGPLREDDLQRMVAMQLGTEAPPQLVKYLWQQAKGHCGFTLDLLHRLVSKGAVVEDDHGVAIRGDILVDNALNGPMAARMDRLSGLPLAQREALAALAIIGPLSKMELCALLPKTRVDDLIQLQRQSLIAEEGEKFFLASSRLQAPAAALPDVEIQSRFHRVALAAVATTARERFVHLRALGHVDQALQAAEQAHGDQPDAHLAVAAGEFAELNGFSEAALWFYRAGEMYREDCQYASAIPFYERSLTRALDPLQRGELFFRLSTAYLRTGDLRGCLQRIDQGLQEASGSWGYRLRGNQAIARAMLGEPSAERDARDAFADSQTAKDWLGMGLASDTLVRLALARGNATGALEWISESARAYRRANNTLGVLRAMGTKALAYRARGKILRADRQSGLAVAAARKCNHRLALSEQLMKLGAVKVDLGQWPAARAAFAEALRLAIEDGRLIEVTVAMSHMAQVDGLLGNPRLARRQARGAVRLTARHQPDLSSYAWRSLAQAERMAGRSGLALLAVRRAHAALRDTQGSEPQWCRIEYGRILAQQGRWKEALNIWETGLRQTAQPESLGVAFLAINAARATLRFEKSRATDQYVERARTLMAKFPSALLTAHCDVFEAERLLVAGNSAEGLRVLGQSLRRFAELPAPYERALAILQAAQLIPAAAAVRAPLTSLLLEAVALFERCGDHHSRVTALTLTVKWTSANQSYDAPERELGLIERASWLLSSLTDLDELLRRAMRAVVEQLDAERGVLLLVDPLSGEMTTAAEYGQIETSTRVAALGYSKRVVHQVAEGGDSLLVFDAGSDSRTTSASVEAMHIQSILCVPLFTDGRLLGMVYLDDSRRTHAFAETQRSMVEGFVHLIAVAIDKSRSHDEAQQANTRLGDENVGLRTVVGKSGHAFGVIGASAPMRRVLTMVEHAARTKTTVLLTGENGTGKQLIAEALHRSGKRAHGPFVTVNCGAITDTLLESELFGILPNVATGVRGRTGKFVQADGGTLFLDEVGDMPMSQQVALLAAIQQRTVTPVGGQKEVAFDARIVAATNRSLRSLVELGKFREDLFFRLSVIEIAIPPLRERKADIPELSRAFLAQFAKQQERDVPKLSPDFFAVLLQSDWPGNVRELQNYLERLLALTPGSYLSPEPAPRDVSSTPTRAPARNRRLARVIKDYERRVLMDALRASGGNQSQAARDLGLTEQALRYRLKKHRMQLVDTKGSNGTA